MQPPVARQWSLLQAMYYGPVVDRTGSSCSASDLQHPRSPRSRRRGRVAETAGVAVDTDADADADAEGELLYQREEPAYVVLDVQSKTKEGKEVDCHAVRPPGRRRTGGNAFRILLLATAAAFIALAVSPGKFPGCFSNSESARAAGSLIRVGGESKWTIISKTILGSELLFRGFRRSLLIPATSRMGLLDDEILLDRSRIFLKNYSKPYTCCKIAGCSATHFRVYVRMSRRASFQRRVSPALSENAKHAVRLVQK